MEKTQSQTPPSFLLMLAGIILALLTFFASVIGFLSIKQAPASPPLIQTK